MPFLPARGVKFYVTFVVLVRSNRFALMQGVETRGAAQDVFRADKKHLKAAEQLSSSFILCWRNHLMEK